MKKPGLLIVLLITLMATGLHAEYRAYLLEVYDHIDKKKWEIPTGFSPDKYITTHGGGNRLSAFVKATWRCDGDTSHFKAPCPMPNPIEPKFQKGERVKITLEKHITEGWTGIVELAYYQAGINSNVYGVRFGEKRQLYNRYFEFNLAKAESPPPAPAAQAGGSGQAQPPAAAQARTQ